MDKLVIRSLDEIDNVAREFVEKYGSSRIVAFYGEMGVGKTTFIKALCRVMGIVDEVNSPSFAIVNEYRTVSGDTVFHFDFYRLKSIEEAIDIGYEEYVYSGNYCFMEWPEKIEPILPEERLDILIEENDDNSRTIKVKTT